MSNVYKGRTGIDRVVRATGCWLSSLRTAYRGESAFRSHRPRVVRTSRSVQTRQGCRECSVFLSLMLCGGIWAAALRHQLS